MTQGGSTQRGARYPAPPPVRQITARGQVMHTKGCNVTTGGVGGRVSSTGQCAHSDSVQHRTATHDVVDYPPPPPPPLRDSYRIAYCGWRKLARDDFQGRTICVKIRCVLSTPTFKDFQVWLGLTLNYPSTEPCGSGLTPPPHF